MGDFIRKAVSFVAKSRLPHCIIVLNIKLTRKSVKLICVCVCVATSLLLNEHLPRFFSFVISDKLNCTPSESMEA